MFTQTVHDQLFTIELSSVKCYRELAHQLAAVWRPDRGGPARRPRLVCDTCSAALGYTFSAEPADSCGHHDRGTHCRDLRIHLETTQELLCKSSQYVHTSSSLTVSLVTPLKDQQEASVTLTHHVVLQTQRSQCTQT